MVGEASARVTVRRGALARGTGRPQSTWVDRAVDPGAGSKMRPRALSSISLFTVVEKAVELLDGKETDKPLAEQSQPSEPHGATSTVAQLAAQALATAGRGPRREAALRALRLRVSRASRQMFRALGTDSARNPSFTVRVPCSIFLPTFPVPFSLFLSFSHVLKLSLSLSVSLSVSLSLCLSLSLSGSQSLSFCPLIIRAIMASPNITL